MKVLILLVILGASAVIAKPFEEKREIGKPETITTLELVPADITFEAGDELVRDKRHRSKTFFYYRELRILS